MGVSDKLGFDPSKIFIGGAWMAPEGGETLALENPSTGETVGRIARGRAPEAVHGAAN